MNLRVPLMILMVMLSGCYSVSPIETQRDVQAAIPPGTSASQAYETLQQKQFSPHYENSKLLRRQRTTGMFLLMPMDWVDVSVELDDADRVKNVSASIEQSYP